MVRNRLLALVIKDLKRFFRDKATIAVLILQPILVMGLTGIVFKEGVQNVPVAIVLENSTDSISKEIIRAMVSDSRFYVKKFVGSEEEAKELIDRGVVQGAILVKNGKIKVLIDGSKPMYVFALTKLTYDAASTALEKSIKEDAASLERTQEIFFNLQQNINVKGSIIRSFKNLKVYGPYFEQLYPLPYNLYSSHMFSSLPLTDYIDLFRYKTQDLLIEQEKAATLSKGMALQNSQNFQSLASLLYLKGLSYNDAELLQAAGILEHMALFSRLSASKSVAQLAQSEFPSILPQKYSVGTAVFPVYPYPVSISSLLQMITLLSKGFILPSQFKFPGINLEFEVLYDGDKLRFLDLMTPLFIALTVAFTAVTLTAPSIVRERMTGTLERVMTTPVRKIEIILGKIISTFLFTFAQGLLMILVGVLGFRVHMSGNPWLLVLFLVPIIFSHLGLGAMISAVSKTDREALQAATLVLLISIILSGMMIPVEMFPSYIRPISRFIPLAYAHNMILGVMVKGAPLSAFWKDLLALLFFSTTFLIGGVAGMLKGGEV